MKTVTLPSGEKVPALGQGTWMMGERRERRSSEIAALRAGVECGMTLIDDRPLPLKEVLQDAELAPVVSYEGSLGYVRYRTEGAISRKNWFPRRSKCLDPKDLRHECQNF